MQVTWSNMAVTDNCVSVHVFCSRTPIRDTDSVLALVLTMPVGSRAVMPVKDIQVKMNRQGDVITVHVRFPAPVSARHAYEVLTDYDHIEQFLPDLNESRLLVRTNDSLLVRQTGKVPFGLFTIPLEYVRRVELYPDVQLVSHVVSGSIERRDATTSLNESHGQTINIYDSEASMEYWVPFGIGNKAIASHIKQTFKASLQKWYDAKNRRAPLKRNSCLTHHPQHTLDHAR